MIIICIIEHNINSNNKFKKERKNKMFSYFLSLTCKNEDSYNDETNILNMYVCMYVLNY